MKFKYLLLAITLPIIIPLMCFGYFIAGILIFGLVDSQIAIQQMNNETIRARTLLQDICINSKYVQEIQEAACSNLKKEGGYNGKDYGIPAEGLWQVNSSSPNIFNIDQNLVIFSYKVPDDGYSRTNFIVQYRGKHLGNYNFVDYFGKDTLLKYEENISIIYFYLDDQTKSFSLWDIGYGSDLYKNSYSERVFVFNKNDLTLKYKRLISYDPKKDYPEYDSVEINLETNSISFFQGGNLVQNFKLSEEIYELESDHGHVQ